MTVTAPKASALYASAAKFAQYTLEAHHKGDHQRVAIDAGTALEHLTKACLARRSPALLAELKPGRNNWASLALLCGFPEGEPEQVRTVGLREAHSRLQTFVSSEASEPDLALLINLRDGVVHAAVNEQIEERILVAFVQQAEAILADMGSDRARFWRDWIEVVNALLSNATDQVLHRVRVKLEAAKASFLDKYDRMPGEITKVIAITNARFAELDEAAAECPACGSQGVAGGKFSSRESVFSSGEVVEHHHDEGEPHLWGMVRFTAQSFFCHLCGLRLTTPAELAAARVPGEWDVPEMVVPNFVRYVHHNSPFFEAAREWANEPGEIT